MWLLVCIISFSGCEVKSQIGRGTQLLFLLRSLKLLKVFSAAAAKSLLLQDMIEKSGAEQAEPT